MNNRRLLLLSLLVVAAYLAFFGDKTPSDKSAADVVQAVPARAKGSSGANKSALTPAENRPVVSRLLTGKAASTLEVDALIPRDTLIPAASDDQGDRDLFPALSWTPPPPPPPPPAKPPPPMAPPVPFVYLGKKLEGGQWEAYLGRGEEVFIVREGMALDGTYQVKSINPPTLTLVYLPLKQSQTIPIGGSQ
ncbi:hypothetical protein [Candidatus Accumulibacter vicinus]|uniref:Secretion system X translation initiation factor n=1 Tax=Candidatus Accumulibacter vicinus TaxID=2954382 RepID=A0A084Y5T3_9PROT|nr:hypothetical protein [Candidatus Accumulibacter vicinus]KFB70077.1 MAG: hypothetical protein CAPSK01_000090 [Candidatus Accumulibacter vicinus]